MRLKKVTINSLLLSIFISISFVAQVITSIIGRDGVFFPLLITLLVISILVNLKKWIVFPRKPLLVFCFFLMFFVSSYFIHGSNEVMNDYFLFFIAYSTVGIQLLKNEINIDKVMYYNLIIIFLGAFPTYIYIYDSTDIGMWLGFSYGILFPFLSSVYIIFRNKIYSKLTRIISFCVLIFYGNIFLQRGARGAIVCIISYFALLVVFNKIKKAHIRLITLSYVFLIVAFLYFNFLQVVNFISNILEVINIRVFALDRIIQQAEVGDITSGRDSLNSIAIEGVRESIFHGNGIGSFEMQHNIYVHNIFLQFLYEGGVVYFLILLVIVGSFIYFLFKSHNSKEKYFLMLLFSSGFLPLLFSLVYWERPMFWLFIYYLCGYSQREKQNESIKLIRSTQSTECLINDHTKLGRKKGKVSLMQY